MSSLAVGKGGAYIFIETTFSLVLGYVFWFVMARVSTSEVVGISSAVISMTGIFISLVTIGIPNGIPRFLGKCFAEQNTQDAKIFIKISILLISIGIIVFSVLILAYREWAEQTFGISFDLVLTAILIIASTAMTQLYRSIVISTLKTRLLPIVMIFSSFFKIIMAIILVLAGMGAYGLLIGFAMSQVISTIVLGIYVGIILKSFIGKSIINFKTTSKDILSASISYWLPSIITTIGTQLGTIIVFGAHGASKAGIFFIAFSVFSALSGIMSSLFTIAYPALSSMKDGRKRFAWRITKFSLIISLPFSAWLMFYGKYALQLFNQSYAEGAPTLEILMLSMLPMAITSGVNILVYAYGKYKQVLIIGFVSTVPRAILYFVLIPIYGIWGAGLSYTIGSISGLIVSLLIAKKTGMKIPGKELVYLFIIPHMFAAALSYVNMNPIASFVIIPSITWVLLLKIKIITRMDLQDSIGVLPNKISRRTLTIVNKIGEKLNNSY